MRILYLLLMFQGLSCLLVAQPIPVGTSVLEMPVSLSVNGMELEKVLQQLNQQYYIKFSYSSHIIPLQEKITVNVHDQPLTLVLQAIFGSKGISYINQGKRIILYRVQKSLEQTVRGTLNDQASKAPISGASVIIVGSDPLLGAITDEQGYFRLEHVPVGRQILRVSHVGYETYFVPAMLIGTGKEAVLPLELRESVLQIDEVVVSSTTSRLEPVNEMATISARHLPVTEAKRYATSLNDPARIVSGYAGVSGDDYLENALVIRGNSSRGLLWRLEGIEIPNPNHFADEGAASGGVSIVSGHLLSNSDFLTGAFPAQYGNALSGVLDLRLRRGNNEKREYSIQAGSMGLDVAMEGPFRKGRKASYLVNYRYSLFSLLNNVGFDVGQSNTANRFQDLAFKLNFPTRRLGVFSFFGIGGLSGYSTDSTRLKGLNQSDMGVLGFSHHYQINSSTSLSTVLSYSGTSIRKKMSLLNPDTTFSAYGESFDKTYTRLSLSLNKKVNARHILESGITVSLLSYNFRESGQKFQTGPIPETNIFDDHGKAGLFQGYLSWRYNIRGNLALVSGLHAMHFGLNKRTSLEPRAGLTWQWKPQHSLHFGFGLHSRIEPLQYYFARFVLPNQTSVQYNRNLDFTKARHYIVGYHYQINPLFHLRLETYYQDLYNIAVRSDSSNIFSTISVYEGFTNAALVNQGAGSNYGLELSLEKSFARKYFVIWNGSLYKAKYRTIDLLERNTPYNGSFTTNLLAGKEFQLGSHPGRHQLSINTRAVWAGGKRYIPINLAESIARGREVSDLKEAYQHQLDNYFRLDLQITYRFNRPRFTGEWRLDIFNLTHQQNAMKLYYNPQTQTIERQSQLGIFPVVAYRMEF